MFAGLLTGVSSGVSQVCTQRVLVEYLLVKNQWRCQGEGWSLRGNSRRTVWGEGFEEVQTLGWPSARGGRDISWYRQSSSRWKEMAGVETREGSEVSSWTASWTTWKNLNSILWALTPHHLLKTYSSRDVSRCWEKKHMSVSETQVHVAARVHHLILGKHSTHQRWRCLQEKPVFCCLTLTYQPSLITESFSHKTPTN